MKVKLFSNPITTSLFWGTAGGPLLIFTHDIFSKGYYGMVSYPIILLAALLTFKPKAEKNIPEFFKTGFFTFMVMTIILYLEIILIENPVAIHMPLTGYLWRLALMATIGAVSSFILTFLILLFRNAKRTA